MLQEIQDIFFLPLTEIRQWLVTQTASFDWQARVRELREEWEQARQYPPVLNPTPNEGGLVQGMGTGGRMVGRCVIHRPGVWQGLGKDRIVIARTLLPMELPLLDVGALVVETGGLLDHVAVQARERNLPAVVGAVGATSIFRDGEFILVDADRGMVIRLNGISKE
jgi:pyruvate,water dikinase